MLSHQDLLPGVPEPPTAGRRASGPPNGGSPAPRPAQRVRHPHQLLEPHQDHRRLEQHRAGGQQAQYYSTNGGATWGQTTLPLVSRRLLPLRPDRRLDVRRHRLVDDHRHHRGGDRLQLRVLPVDRQRRHLDLRQHLLRHPDEHRQADDLGRPQRHLALSQDTLYAIWHNGNPVFINRAPARRRLGHAAPGERRRDDRHGIGADVKTNSAGDVFGFWPDTGSRDLRRQVDQRRRQLRDAGEHRHHLRQLRHRRAVRSTAAALLIYVSAGAYRNASKNDVYAVWTDLSGDTGCTSAGNEPGTNTASACKTRIWFSRSTDGGATWSAPGRSTTRPA